MLSRTRKRTLCQLVIFICSFVNFVIQLCVCLWPTWVTMVPKRASDLKPFENQGAMLGLWRQCLRTMPGEFTCDDQPPGQGQAIKRLGEGDESPEVFYSISTMRWLIIVSVVFSGLSNATSLLGYECITLARDNYKFRRRCIRFSGFLIFLSGLCSVVALSYFAYGVFDELFAALRLRLELQFRPLRNGDYVYNFNPIIYIGWFSSGLGLLCGICLCCLAGSMYDTFDGTSSKQLKKRHYPYDLELDTKYREYTANNLQKMQNSGALNYKDDQMRQTQSSGEKMNQIQTLDHHGRKRHVKAKTALLQNGTVPGSKVIDYGKVIDSAIVQEGSVPLHKNDSVDSLTNDSQQDDFSFTLPKPQNIAPNKVESLTDCDMETSLAVGARSVQSTQGRPHRDLKSPTETTPCKSEFYAMEGYV